MTDSDHAPLSSDAPIKRRADDLFNRARLAERIAVEARIAGDDAGFVIALCGEWGTGKTSIGNMIADAVGANGDDVVIQFNPWMFTGAEDLVGRFFGQLAAALGKREGKLRDVAAHVTRYAGALAGVTGFIPMFGGTASSVLGAAQRVAALTGDVPTLEERREELITALNELDGRIIVFLDDLDRLTDDEIREIVRLVKLVGDLPHITYILSFDRQRVEQALGAPEVDADRARERGRAYLEKIVQMRHDVAPLRASTAVRFMIEQVDIALAPYDVSHDNQADWGNLLGLALRYMIHTPRDARRVANALPAAVELYGDEVALVDLFGLEALRVLEPDVHARLPTIAEILVDDRHVIGTKDIESDRARIDEALLPARHPEAVRNLLGQLFPRAQPALANVRATQPERAERRGKRVGVASVFRAYLHLALDDDTLGAPAVEQLAALLGDPGALRDALDATPGSLLNDALERLMDFKDQFRPEDALAAAHVFMALEPRLPADESPIFARSAPSSWNLHTLVGNLLLSEPDPAKRAEGATRLAEDAPDLSTRLRAINWFGTHPDRENRDADSEMIGEEETARLAGDLRERVLAARPADLASEHLMSALVAGLLHPDEDAGHDAIREKTVYDAFMLKLLSSQYGDRKAQTLGEAAVRRIPHLAWAQLVALLGEDHLRDRLEALDATVDQDQLDDDQRAALTLALEIARGETKQSAA